MRAKLPYLAEYPGRPGSSHPETKIGWAEGNFEIGEAQPDEFRVAARQHKIARYTTCLYAARGYFWKSAEAEGSLDDRFETAVLREPVHRADLDTLHLQPLEGLCGTAAKTARMGELGQRVFRKLEKAPPSEPDGEDRERFGAWASEHLLAVEGRLMVRAHSPSLALTFSNSYLSPGMTFEGFPHPDCCNPVGAREFVLGVHFDLADEEGMEQLLDSAGSLNTFSVAARPSVAWTPSISTPSYFTKRGSYVFDGELLAGMEHVDENLAAKSLVALANHISIASTTPVRGYRGEHIREIRTVLRTGDIAAEDELEKLAYHLSALTTPTEPARSFFIRAAVDKWEMRPIALRHALNGPNTGM